MSNYLPCPKCGSENIEKMSYTWWGGIIGPAILSHVKCNDCGNQYNGRNGTSNTLGIILYFVALIIIGVVLFMSFAK